MSYDGGGYTSTRVGCFPYGVCSDGDNSIGEDLYAPYIPITGVSEQAFENFAEYERKFSNGAWAMRYDRLFTSDELCTLEACVSDSVPVGEHDRDCESLSTAVEQVIAISLDEAFCSKENHSYDFANPAAVESVTVPPEVVQVGYGPAAHCVGRLFGDEPNLGVVLAWYARAVTRGYAGPVKLVRDKGRWSLKKGVGGPVRSMKDILAFVREHAVGDIDKEPDKRCPDRVISGNVGKMSEMPVISENGRFGWYKSFFPSVHNMEVMVVDTSQVFVDKGACLLLPYSLGWETVVAAVAKGVYVNVHSLGGDLAEVSQRVILPRGRVGNVFCGIVTRDLFWRMYAVGVRSVVVVTDKPGEFGIVKTVSLGCYPPSAVMKPFCVIVAVMTLLLFISIGDLPWFVVASALAALSLCLTYHVKFWFSEIEVA